MIFSSLYYRGLEFLAEFLHRLADGEETSDAASKYISLPIIKVNYKSNKKWEACTEALTTVVAEVWTYAWEQKL